MDIVGTEMEILGKNQKKMLEFKTIIREMKSPFDGLISRVDMDKERISELEDMSLVILQTEMQRQKRLGG